MLKGTDLAADYEKQKFHIYERKEYLDILIDCLEHLDPSIVVHRMTGDGPKDLLLAPLWSGSKREVLNLLHHQMKERGSFQGKGTYASGVMARNARKEVTMATPFTIYKLIVLYMLPACGSSFN